MSIPIGTVVGNPVIHPSQYKTGREGIWGHPGYPLACCWYLSASSPSAPFASIPLLSFGRSLACVARHPEEASSSTSDRIHPPGTEVSQHPLFSADYLNSLCYSWGRHRTPEPAFALPSGASILHGGTALKRDQVKEKANCRRAQRAQRVEKSTREAASPQARDPPTWEFVRRALVWR